MIFKKATEGSEGATKPEKNPAVVALGRLVGLKNGKARAKKLSAEERTEIARRPLKQDGQNMRNEAIKHPTTWKEDGLTFKELIRQEYDGNHCIIRGGFVEGEGKPLVDTIFLRLEKDGVEPTTLLLRPDEMQAIAWIASGTVWSHLMNLKEPD